MTLANRWLLPEGVEEILPEEAFKLESLRRQTLDLYSCWGYQMVVTPLVEYLDSLLVGSSHDLDLHTFKVTDQLSGRMMGIRADITPQVARIDARCLNREGPARLCYADSVLHTKPRGLLTSRAPIRLGAELYGHAGIECDVELICLMQQTLQLAGISDIHLVLGHVGVFRNLVAEARLQLDVEKSLFDAIQRKAFDEIDTLLVEHVSDERLRCMLRDLSLLTGGEEALSDAADIFSNAPDSVKAELKELQTIVSAVKRRLPDATLCFDLCELRGYEYHTGIVFAAYTPEYGRAVAKGGRYDHIGEVFGRSRPASGFDCDLKTLARLTTKTFNRPNAILAPLDDEDSELRLVIDKLRASGETVIQSLYLKKESEGYKDELGCDRQLEKSSGTWDVVPVK